VGKGFLAAMGVAKQVTMLLHARQLPTECGTDNRWLLFLSPED
jgi:hypothetical protein